MALHDLATSSPLQLSLLLFPPLPLSIPGPLSSFLCIKHTGPTSEPLHWLFPLSDMLFPDIHTPHLSSLSGFCSNVTCLTRISMTTLFKIATISPLHYSRFFFFLTSSDYPLTYYIIYLFIMPMAFCLPH